MEKNGEWAKKNDDEYGKYDEMCNKIYFKFRSNWNLPGNLNEKYTTNVHHIVTF